MNGKFIEKYGSTWKEMSEDMKSMAIMSELFDLDSKLVPLMKVVAQIPCIHHSSRIDTLEEWHKVCDAADILSSTKNESRKLETFKGGISLKNAIIMIVIANGFTLLVTVAIKLIFG
jgi:hypothetical protein